jgi:hypothetical protein
VNVVEARRGRLAQGQLASVGATLHLYLRNPEGDAALIEAPGFFDRVR